jgi:methylenetetrahydrofolate dehydrogenase (NADP+)/methenyltetrahydrofolate cyclohydrolase
MIVDGTAIADRVYARARDGVAALKRTPTVAIITCAPNFETRKYLALKKRKARVLGIHINIIELPPDSATSVFVGVIQDAASSADALIVQLPLPAGVDTDAVLSAIPPDRDADALNPATTTRLSPVVGAIYEILVAHNVQVQDASVTVIGSGRLVGLPAARWFQSAGASVSIVTKDTADIAYYTRTADIIVSGAGVAGLLTPGMVRDGVSILDAGTSEDGGVLKGDADPACADKAALFTPVPGGIGPITIAILMENVVKCAEIRQTVL